MQTTKNKINSHINRYSEFSLEAYTVAYKTMEEALKKYAEVHNMPQMWLSEMLSKLTEAFTELKASIYFENKVASYMAHSMQNFANFAAHVVSDSPHFTAATHQVEHNQTRMFIVKDKKSLLTHE